MNDEMTGPVIRRGRPKEFDGSVTVRLTQRLHDSLSIEAHRRRIELSKVIRERLERNSVTQK